MVLARELEPIADSLKSWAVGESDLLHVWIYGSHAKGQATAESDLDVAVEVVPREGETPYDVFACLAEGWRSDLAPKVAPHRLDLKLYDKSGQREKVRRAVDEHGVLVYARAT